MSTYPESLKQPVEPTPIPTRGNRRGPKPTWSEAMDTYVFELMVEHQYQPSAPRNTVRRAWIDAEWVKFQVKFKKEMDEDPSNFKDLVKAKRVNLQYISFYIPF